MAAPTRILLDLAGTIQAHAATLHDAVESAGLPEPTFRSGGSPLFIVPPSNEGDRAALLEAIDELRALVLGPVPYTILSAAYWVCARRKPRLAVC